MSTTLAQKVDQASKYVMILNHNEPITEPSKIIWGGLKQLGIVGDDEVSLETLKDCKSGHARAIFCEQINMPVPRFDKIWSILKDGAEEKSTSTSMVQPDLKNALDAMRPIGQLSNRELLQRYKDNLDDSAAEEELKKRSLGENCVAFYKEEIDIDLSASLLAKAKRGVKVPSVLNKDNKIYRIRKVGKFPQEAYDVCPVTGAILFENYSEGLGVSWIIPLEARQFIWIMNDQGIKIDAFVANNIQSLYVKEGMDALKLQYPKIAELYDDLFLIGDLPSLKTNLSAKESKNLDPFRGNRKF